MRIDFLSRQFLDLDYIESTLIGDTNTPEVFVINLKGVDCFTFIDYIEAMRLSGSFSEFKKNLRRIRYKSGKVTFKNRNHFFTDWRVFNSDFISDVTEEIGGEKVIHIKKTLNAKGDRTSFVEGIHPFQREIKYIPADSIDDSILKNLRTGDYAGVYSRLQGLDVSHVGIIIKDKDRIFLRHASSQKNCRKVVDNDFKHYIINKPGIIVLRPKDSQ
ncbi:MAG: N-acetylmuramoyl-L-alanine amidase-like domain-containing protein [Nitrospirota bacterium]